MMLENQSAREIQVDYALPAQFSENVTKKHVQRFVQTRLDSLEFTSKEPSRTKIKEKN